eukprot:GEMP01030097.1.p1 GENE.GEMP01030097.1~~GEMP01030097.1.p1  ORF type:complete len:243 (+),score=40.15 GEMP01030097.1:209-937(+)
MSSFPATQWSLPPSREGRNPWEAGRKVTLASSVPSSAASAKRLAVKQEPLEEEPISRVASERCARGKEKRACDDPSSLEVRSSPKISGEALRDSRAQPPNTTNFSAPSNPTSTPHVQSTPFTPVDLSSSDSSTSSQKRPCGESGPPPKVSKSKRKDPEPVVSANGANKCVKAGRAVIDLDVDVEVDLEVPSSEPPKHARFSNCNRQYPSFADWSARRRALYAPHVRPSSPSVMPRKEPPPPV